MIEVIVYTELPHPIMEAIIAWFFSVLTEVIVLYSSSCEFKKNRVM